MRNGLYASWELFKVATLLIAISNFLPAQQTVWFTPLPASSHPVGFFGSVDYMSLFRQKAPWQQAASHVRVFEIYADRVDALSNTELRTLLLDLKRRKIALALEWPVLTSRTCGMGIEGFGGSPISIAQRIKAQGGTLAYIAMQQPFQWGSLYKGANSCQWTARQVAANALIHIKEAKAIFPKLQVGDIMAVPPFRDSATDWAASYGVWFDTWRRLSGAPLAFFHVDADWTVPNWQAAVDAVRPVAAQRRIPFGMVYNGFLTDETDDAWLAAAENHLVGYEVHSGNAPPEHVVFQSWNPHPTHVLPETDPTAFTHLIDRYFRTRTRLTLTNKGAKLSGTLRAGSAAVPGARVQITAHPVSGPGGIYTYTLGGTVPAQARSAIVGARVNSECYLCNGPSDLTIYNFQYSDTNQHKPFTWDFAKGISGWAFGPGPPVFDPGPAPYVQGLHIKAAPGQGISMNSTAVPVTPKAQFSLRVTARVSPGSVGTGYFTLIWFNGNGNEPSREILLFQPKSESLGTATTDADGSFTISSPQNSTAYEISAEFAGSDTLWPAVVKLR